MYAGGCSAVVDARGLQNREDAGSNPVTCPPRVVDALVAEFGSNRAVAQHFERSTDGSPSASSSLAWLRGLRILCGRRPSRVIPLGRWASWPGTTSGSVQSSWHGGRTSRSRGQEPGGTQLRLARPLAADLRFPPREAGRTEQTAPRPCPTRVSEPANEDRLSNWCTETVPPYAWSPARLEEPPSGHRP